MTWKITCALLLLYTSYFEKAASNIFYQPDGEYIAEYDHRTPEEIRAINAVIFPKESPEPLLDKHLMWMTARHKFLVKKAKDNGANEWEELLKIADIYYDQHASRRAQSKAALTDYCMRNLNRLIGKEAIDKLIELHEESATVDHIVSAFYAAVGKLTNDEFKNQAEQYGQFCKKIFRFVTIEPNELFSWLSDDQMAQLQLLIIDKKVSDDEVYQKVYDFFNETHEKEEAQEAVEGACRRFIADLFGDDIVEELEEMRENSAIPQLMAARLGQQLKELDNGARQHPSHTREAVKLCEKIYLNFHGECDCGGFAEECDENSHVCLQCSLNTDGDMCDKCAEGMVRDLNPSLGCVVACECSNHADSCDENGTCLNCTDHTAGRNCERCEPGFVGNPCQPCDCPQGSNCRLSETDEPECFEGQEVNSTPVFQPSNLTQPDK